MTEFELPDTYDTMVDLLRSPARADEFAGEDVAIMAMMAAVEMPEVDEPTRATVTALVPRASKRMVVPFAIVGALLVSGAAAAATGTMPLPRLPLLPRPATTVPVTTTVDVVLNQPVLDDPIADESVESDATNTGAPAPLLTRPPVITSGQRSRATPPTTVTPRVSDPTRPSTSPPTSVPDETNNRRGSSSTIARPSTTDVPRSTSVPRSSTTVPRPTSTADSSGKGSGGDSGRSGSGSSGKDG